MQKLAEKILQTYETGSPEGMNALGELYLGLADSSVVQNNEALKQLFKESGPVVNHSLALMYFDLAEKKKSSALSEKGRLALGLKAYFDAQKVSSDRQKKALFMEANAKLKDVGDRHPDFIPATICANLGIWFYKERMFDIARYWLNLLRKAHMTTPFLNKEQCDIMQNYRAGAIVHDENNFENFCLQMIQKCIPLSKEIFHNFMKLMLNKESLNQEEIKILSWMYKSEQVSKEDKLTISSKLGRHYISEQDWFMALHWFYKSGDKTLKDDIDDALDASASKWKLYLLPRYQIVAGLMLLLCGTLTTFALNLKTIPQYAISGLVFLCIIALVLIILYVRTIGRRRSGFLWGVGQVGFGVASLVLLKPTGHLCASLQHILIPCIFSLAYFLFLLSMPEMFKFDDFIYKIMTDFFRWGDNK